EPLVIYPDCGTWHCPVCGAKHLVAELANAANRFHGDLWQLACPDEQKAWGRLRKQINRRDGDYWRIRDGDRWLVVTNRPVRGAEPITPAEALARARVLLNARTWECRPITTSHNWCLPPRENTSDFVRDGKAGITSLAALEEIAQKYDADL